MRRSTRMKTSFLIFLILSFAVCGTLFAQDDLTQPKRMPATKQGMFYYVSLPSGWNASRKWPMVVTIDGSGDNWETNAKNFAKARKEMPFVIVTPVMLRHGPPEKRQYPQALLDRVGDDADKWIEFNDKGLFAVIR